jgi:hypothetical protein
MASERSGFDSPRLHHVYVVKCCLYYGFMTNLRRFQVLLTKTFRSGKVAFTDFVSGEQRIPAIKFVHNDDFLSLWIHGFDGNLEWFSCGVGAEFDPQPTTDEEVIAAVRSMIHS